MSTIYCLLGSTPELSLAELHAVVGVAAVKRLNEHLVSVELPDAYNPQDFFNTLGGCVKFLKPIALLQPEGDQVQAVTEFVIDNLASRGPKVTFGLAELGRDHLASFDLAAIKNELKSRGVSARYIESPRSGLSASVLLHQNNVVELLIASTDEGVVIAETQGVQDIDSWSHRDRSKPYADRKKGMLPPKVARMLLNIGLGAFGVTEPAKPETLAAIRVFDPFCGTGTILLEAAERGCSVVGSDSDPASVVGSQKNLEWLLAERRISVKSEWLLGEVAHATPRQPVQLIVTEPFLGKQTPHTEQLPAIFKGLEKLYLGAFKHWQKVLVPGGVVVMILPRVTTPKFTYRCQALIDKLPLLRYTTSSEPLEYYRPQAVVEREVWVFTYLGQIE